MSRMKRILTLFLVMVMLCTLLPAGLAYADSKHDAELPEAGEIKIPGEDNFLEEPKRPNGPRFPGRPERPEESVETPKPEISPKPESSPEPVPTETPESSPEPAPTETPAPTVEPAPTMEPEETEAPEESEEPENILVYEDGKDRDEELPCAITEGCCLPDGHEDECRLEEEDEASLIKRILHSPWLIALSISVLALIALGVVFLLKARKPRSAFDDNETTVRLNGSDIRLPISDAPIMMKAFRAIGDRAGQQDYFIYDNTEHDADVGRLAIVCDGMGGMQGGEIASSTCAELIMQSYYQVGATDDICELMSHLAVEADKKVYALTDAKGKKMESGTTLVCVSVYKDVAYWISVGDSRIYLYQNGGLHQLTRDHNFRIVLQQQCNDGLITQEEVDTCPEREALISYIGKGGDLLIDRGELSFATENDGILILCSDGLYKGLSDSEIAQIVSQNLHNTEALPKLLVEAALAADTGYRKDNTTVLCISRNTKY